MNLVHYDVAIVLDLVTAVEVVGEQMFTVNVYSVGGAARSFYFDGPGAEHDAHQLRDAIVAALESMPEPGRNVWVAGSHNLGAST